MSFAGFMSSAPPSAPAVSYGQLIHSFEWVYWGMIVSLGLFGVTLVQSWRYHHSNRDRWPLRSLVYFLIACDTATTVLIALTGHYYFISHFGDYEALGSIVGLFGAEIAITMVLTFAVQFILIWQIYSVRKSILPWLGFCSIFSFAGLAMGIFVVQQLSTADTKRTVQSHESQSVNDISNAAQLSFAVADILLAGTLCKVLLAERSGIARSDALIKRIIVYAINRGVLVSICQILFAVLGFVNQRGLSWVFFHLLLSPLYTNTMLAIYNARPGLRHNYGSNSNRSNSISLSRASVYTDLSPRAHSRFPVQTLEISETKGGSNGSSPLPTLPVDQFSMTPSSADEFGGKVYGTEGSSTNDHYTLSREGDARLTFAV